MARDFTCGTDPVSKMFTQTYPFFKDLTMIRSKKNKVKALQFINKGVLFENAFFFSDIKRGMQLP